MSPPASLHSQPVNKESEAKPIHHEDAEKNFQLKSPKFWTIMLGMYLSIFLVGLDRTIIATAIPRITDEFDSIQDIGWYGSAYMLAAACLFPITGRVYQLYSTKWTFLASLVLFEVGSAICGAAPSSITFIIGRAISGAGSAFIFTGGIMIIIPLVPLHKRPVFTSLFGSVMAIASIIGPVLGGAFTDKITWRWCFYINLPLGAFTIVGVLLFLHIDSGKRETLTVFQQIKRLDPVGVSVFVPSMVCLILALQWGGTTYPWSAPRIIGLLVAFAVLFIIFATVEVLMPETAMAPTRVVLNRSMAGSMTYTFLISGGMMSIIYYLTIWFQAAKGDSAIHAGIKTIPLILSMVVISFMSALFTQKVGYYIPAMLLSSVMCAVGAGLLSTLVPSSGHSHWIGYQVLYGLGLGCGFQQSNLAAQTVLKRSDVPLGMAMVFFMQQLGGSVFLSVSQNIFSSKLVNKLSGVSGLNPQVIVNTGATDLRSVISTNELTTVVDAYNYSLTRTFLLAAILSACMIVGPAVMEWRSIKVKKSSGDATKAAESNLEKGENK